MKLIPLAISLIALILSIISFKKTKHQQKLVNDYFNKLKATQIKISKVHNLIRTKRNMAYNTRTALIPRGSVKKPSIVEIYAMAVLEQNLREIEDLMVEEKLV